MEQTLKWVRRYVSPVFMVLLAASFILWYIAKLNYTYTTGHTVRMDVDGQLFEVACTVEGVGTNLFSYQVYARKTLRVPLSELKYKRSREEGHEGKIILDPKSLQSVLSKKFSDIKIISLDAIPEIDFPTPEQ